jgi:propanol-preferring alcohol dehydrogenase
MRSASTIVRSLIESEQIPGNWAVFPAGGGGVGIQGVQLAKAVGFTPIAIDIGDGKKNFALDMGAEAFVDFKTSSDVAKEVIASADGVGAYGVFVTAPVGYKTAVSLVGERIGAKVMCIAILPRDFRAHTGC